ncbi:phage tail tape measure protein [Paenibacillus sp. 203]|uniref:phage tail tape measure protein n=1 Tax=Paenibacillus sp. 203 TaxID=3096765 RepID=UPI003009693C
MAETIKGINVVIGAETTGLSAALSDVNKRSKDLQGELKQVEKLLKLDPGNTELLAQKQKILTDAVANTSDKLNTLRAAQQQVNEQFARGDITEGQYRAFQRELVQTEQELKKLQNSLNSLNAPQIDVVINGDTRNLNDALADANKRSKDLQAELRQVDQLLRFDPGNTELLAQKQKLLTDAIANTSDKLNTLRSAQQQVTEQFQRGDISEEQYRAFQRELVRTEQELQRFENGLREARGELDDLEEEAGDAGDQLGQVGDKFKAAGDKMKGVGTALTVGVTAPLVALGTTAGKVALDLDAASGKMRASLGVTADQADKLALAAQSIWKNGFGESLDEVNEALITTRTNIQGLDDSTLTDLTQKAVILKEAFDAEVNETTRTASVLMKNFGIDGSEAMDLITVGFQRGGNFSDELLDTLREYAPQFKGLGYSADEFTAILIAGAEKGAFNLDKIGDSAKEAFLKIGDGSGGSRDALKALGLDFKQVENDIASGGESTKKAFTAVVTAISSIKDPAQRAQTAVALMGTPLEDLGPQFRDFFATANTDLGTFIGSTDAAGEALQDNFGARASKMWRELQTDLVPLGQALLDLAEELLPKVQEALKGVTDWLKNLSPESAKTVLAIGGIAAAVGPLLIGLGGLVSTIGTAVTALGAIGGAAGVTGGAMALLSNPVGWVVAGLAAITAAGVALYANWEDIMELSPVLQGVIFALAGPVSIVVAAIKGIQDVMSDSIPAVERFGEDISASTQEAAGAFLDLNDKATLALNQLQWSGQAVTQATAQSIIDTFSQMGDQVLAAMQEDHAAQLQTMTDFYANSAALTETEEAAILEKMKAHQAAQESNVQEGQRKIAAILEEAKNQKRDITDAERTEINRIQQQMVETGIQHMSENELEQRAIMERMKQNASDLSAQQAAEVVANSVKQRDETIKAADEQFNDVIKTIIQQRDEAGTITAEQADKLIKEATRQHDETVAKAKGMHESVIAEAKKQAGEHVNEIDWETGQILSKWDVFVTSTKTKLNDLWTATKGIFSKMYQSVADEMKKIWKNITDEWNEIVAFWKSIDLTQIGADIINGLANGIKSKAESVAKEARAVAKKISDSITEFFDMHSPSRLTTGYGRFVSEGLAIGIRKAGSDAARAAQEVSAMVADSIQPTMDDLNDVSIPNLSGLQSSTGAAAAAFGQNSNTTTYNMDGMFSGATFSVRSDNDIKQLAREIWSMTEQQSRAMGGARA